MRAARLRAGVLASIAVVALGACDTPAVEAILHDVPVFVEHLPGPARDAAFDNGRTTLSAMVETVSVRLHDSEWQSQIKDAGCLAVTFSLEHHRLPSPNDVDWLFKQKIMTTLPSPPPQMFADVTTDLKKLAQGPDAERVLAGLKLACDVPGSIKR